MDHLLSREKDKIDTSIHTKHQKNIVLFGFERLSLSQALLFFSFNNKEGL